ncbi:glycosyltransferase family 28 C-terminal domain-containing protein [Polychytrium aggregatum]|uniref:glycosyltransferase family 28 C-terminal domain-containing protein n=1 Tax=Polychytrium aggregatum TaxID=110093 RepID=UPI0022FDF019|nr:glycosyltransferase family 28 C-terminal domain-containing protein [Polychytrium aggregatum]KAI9203141.1 glycosyltransferase family 28 C-terminal domain-containing protein [Polychytrium aggregatum]
MAQAFVTVGTTRFDTLIDLVSTSSLVARLMNLGFARVVIQHGRSPLDVLASARHSKAMEEVAMSAQERDDVLPSLGLESSSNPTVCRLRKAARGDGAIEQSQEPAEAHTTIEVVGFSFAPSLRRQMEQADLIITHGGSGSILEGLDLRKPLIVVANPKLMDQHQAELGSALSHEGFLYFAADCTEASLGRQLELWQRSDPGLKEWYDCDGGEFVRLLKDEMGFV